MTRRNRRQARKDRREFWHIIAGTALIGAALALPCLPFVLGFGFGVSADIAIAVTISAAVPLGFVAVLASFATEY